MHVWIRDPAILRTGISPLAREKLLFWAPSPWVANTHGMPKEGHCWLFTKAALQSCLELNTCYAKELLVKCLILLSHGHTITWHFFEISNSSYFQLRRKWRWLPQENRAHQFWTLCIKEGGQANFIFSHFWLLNHATPLFYTQMTPGRS